MHGPLGTPRSQQDTEWLPQKHVVVSPAMLQGPTGGPPARMQAAAFSQSCRPTASLMPQQPSLLAFCVFVRQAMQVAATSDRGLVSRQDGSPSRPPLAPPLLAARRWQAPPVAMLAATATHKMNQDPRTFVFR